MKAELIFENHKFLFFKVRILMSTAKRFLNLQQWVLAAMLIVSIGLAHSNAAYGQIKQETDIPIIDDLDDCIKKCNEDYEDAKKLCNLAHTAEVGLCKKVYDSAVARAEKNFDGAVGICKATLAAATAICAAELAADLAAAKLAHTTSTKANDAAYKLARGRCAKLKGFRAKAICLAAAKAAHLARQIWIDRKHRAAQAAAAAKAAKCELDATTEYNACVKKAKDEKDKAIEDAKKAFDECKAKADAKLKACLDAAKEAYDACVKACKKAGDPKPGDVKPIDLEVDLV
ncbi:MAG: hypothetical protein AAF623_12695 [Planctomycetota bacterium]